MARRSKQAGNGNSQSSEVSGASAESGPASARDDASIVDQLANGTFGTEEISFGRRASSGGSKEPEIIDIRVSDGIEGIEGKTADPDAAAGTGETAKKRRGRPPGSGTGKTRSQNKGLDLATIRDRLNGLHMIAALATRSPIFILSDQETEALAVRIVEVSKHYDLDEIISGKRTCLLMLAGTAITIYGGKIIALRQLNAQRRQPAEQPATATDAAVNAGMAANGNNVDLTGEHLKGVHVP